MLCHYATHTSVVQNQFQNQNQLTHTVPVPQAELPETNAFTTMTTLTFLQAQGEQASNTHKQPMYSNVPLISQNTNSSHQSQKMQFHNQSTVILNQFSMTTQELQNFMDKVSGDINKIT